ncbi:MAG: RNA polymerase sigma factor [Bacteroidetes bacterium]|nr:MAG: RNA polymerase sigma factor [Bacteroidota bacterium]
MQIDKAIIEKCKQNDRKAQEQLYKQLYAYIMGICYRYFINNEDAKDIFNMVMLKILTNIQKYDDKYAFSTWVSNISVNTIISEFRKRKKHQHISYVEEYFDSNDYYELNEYVRDADVDEILKCMEGLTDTERFVFNLFTIEGYSHKEIGNMLNISEDTSRWYFNKAKSKLKDMLQKKQILITN